MGILHIVAKQSKKSVSACCEPIVLSTIASTTPLRCCPLSYGPSSVGKPIETDSREHTRFRNIVMGPLASTIAVSPRRETTFPSMRTVWLTNGWRYLALMRGVASEAIVGGRKWGRWVSTVSRLVKRIDQLSPMLVRCCEELGGSHEVLNGESWPAEGM